MSKGAQSCGLICCVLVREDDLVKTVLQNDNFASIGIFSIFTHTQNAPAEQRVRYQMNFSG